MGFLGIFHATLNAVEPTVEALREHAPALPVRHYMDEGLLQAKLGGADDQQLQARLSQWLQLIETDGATAILMTCSSFSPFATTVRRGIRIPLITIDAAMIEEAVHSGGRICILATLSSAEATTRRLIEQARPTGGGDLEIRTRLIKGAFEALEQGKTDKHDELIRDVMVEEAQHSDTLVLAQISMSRAMRGLDLPARILSSADTAIRAALQACTH